MKLFIYAVVYHPDESGRKKGEKDKIIVPLKLCLAPDENGAKILAAYDVPEAYREKTDRLEVAVRPF